MPTDHIAISDDWNVNTKETEKLGKYEDLKIEASRMWKVRAKIVPVVIGTSGKIKFRNFSCSHVTRWPQSYRSSH